MSGSCLIFSFTFFLHQNCGVCMQNDICERRCTIQRSSISFYCPTMIIGRTLIVVAVALIICSPQTAFSLSKKLEHLSSALKDTLLLLESMRDETVVEEDLLSGLGRPSSCAELLLAGKTESGVYTIYPREWYKVAPFQVYCDMETDGGGWTLFQRRDDFGEPRENFYRVWSDYKKGFGNLTQEFWLGNEHLYILTNQDHVTLRVDLGDFDGGVRYAAYDEFHIASKEDDYKARIGKYKGDAVDDLAQWNNKVFVTHDKNDANKCASKFKGGWWYENCHRANLNGQYLQGVHKSHADGVNWYGYKGHNYSLKKSEMKVRPTNFLMCDDRPKIVSPL